MGATVTVTMFSQLFHQFDDNLMATINTGSANIVSLIAPLMAAGFAIYVMLIMIGYWRGTTDEPILDFFSRMIGWAVVLMFGMNISYYSQYVVPFFNNFGSDIAQALSNSPSTGDALDSISTTYVQALWNLYLDAKGIESTLNAIAFIVLTTIFALPFIAVAAAYIILAKFALGLLLALGPMFISAALFPATRRFFEAWAGQCLNYGLLTALYAAAGMLEINFARTIVPTNINVLQLFQLVMMGIAFLIISLNLPSLASQLAGGVGISSMVGSIAPAMRALRALAKGGSRGGSAAGGSMSAA